MHAPKVETFDVPAMTNTDPKGVVRDVEQYRAEPFGLYLARPTPGRVQFRYLESWLLPELGIRITDFWFNPGYERDQDFYLDVVHIDVDGPVWTSTDLYLDLVLRDGHDVRPIDIDELLEARAAGLLSAERAHHALRTGFWVVDGLASHRHELRTWLGSAGISLSWQRHPSNG